MNPIDATPSPASAHMQKETTMNTDHNRHPRGQVLVIVAVAMVAIVAMVGLVVDGGFAWGKQRDTQNAADAAAEAGAIVMAQRLAGDRKSTRLNSSHGYISYAVF